MLVCLFVLMRHLAIRKARIGTKDENYNQSQTYYFDVKNVKFVLKRKIASKKARNLKRIFVSLKSTRHKEHASFRGDRRIYKIS